uniref:Uncharacterized protein n=1 Tax=Pithovirus LCPAC404 TaxID=2506597 RepID=A0A481ZCI6_9VIRU|nr:MAG: hypothetical protein LCPAC404_00900 [Pithovirus LCPAC404]
MVPGKLGTYVCPDETSYYKQYNESAFAITKPKAGNDCLRHYEILAAGSIPYFIDIEKIPENTMHRFPKKLVLEARAVADENPFNELRYNELLSELRNYTKKHLTTKALGEYFLSETSKGIDVKFSNRKVLLISSSNRLDYQRGSISHGLFEILPKDCFHVYNYPEWLFEDTTNPYLYTKRFSLTGKLPKTRHDPKTKEEIIDNLSREEYDTVIIATTAHYSGYIQDFDEVLRKHVPKNLVIIIGHDGYSYTKEYTKKFVKNSYPTLWKHITHIFVRELRD